MSRRALLVALLLTLAYAAVCCIVLARGFPHEDAYILFKYARDVGRGAGIVFYPGGPHAEGATDFLWMLALAAGTSLRVDPAIGAAILDVAGFFVCACAFVQLLSPIDRPASRLVVLTTLLLLTPCAVASYVGFGTMVYATLALLMYRAHVRGDLLRIPTMGLFLGLLRPDGVILGAAFAALAVPAARQRGILARYLALCLACALAAAAYFAWRRLYFHALLPLPLYVKSHYAGVPTGVGDTLDWTASTLLPLAGLAGVSRLLFGRAPIDKQEWMGLVPFLLHAASFVMITTSQNVANRFEAPAALALFYFALAGASARARLNAPSPARTWTFVAVAGLAFYPQAVIALDVAREALRGQYVDVFAWWLARTGGATLRIASTEAGRMLYWTDGPVLDLVGLNSAETARTPPSRALLERFDPDVVMLHPAGALDEDRMEAGRTGDVLLLTEPIEAYFRPGVGAYAVATLPPYDVLHAANVDVAPIATLGWLATRRDAYDVYAVRFSARFARFHVYAVRKSLPLKDAIVTELARAHVPDARRSHLSLALAVAE